VFAAIDGQAAWDYLKSNPQAPVLIISDIMMPNMGGFDLLKLVREEEKFKSIPFVFMTAALEKDYVIQAKTMKVDGYILKPVTSERIEKKIFELFPDMKRRKMTKIA
jgi:CheY-like chemotaxis protein